MRDALLLAAIATPAIIGLAVLVWGLATLRGPGRTVYDDVAAMRREREAQERALANELRERAQRPRAEHLRVPSRPDVEKALYPHASRRRASR